MLLQNLLNKIYNLISNVTFDIETHSGDIISNISYVNKNQVDDAIDVLKELFDRKPEYCIGNRYALFDEGNGAEYVVYCTYDVNDPDSGKTFSGTTDSFKVKTKAFKGVISGKISKKHLKIKCFPLLFVNI